MFCLVIIGTNVTVTFATVVEAKEILTNRDDFIQSMSPFDRSSRMKTDREISEKDIMKESGDLVVPLKKNLIRKDQVFTLGKWLKGDSRVKKGGLGTRLFKSVGMALFDVVVAHLLYEKAKKKGLGTEVAL